MSGLLDDVRVIDLSEGPIGGLATMVLADFGAGVIKIERPGGDPWRSLANAPVWLLGKRSAVLDLKDDAGRAALVPLVEGADVVVTAMRPGKAAALSCDYERLAAINPALVYCSITASGCEGPYANYPGYEAVVAAKIGRMLNFSGLPDREGPAYAAVQAGSHACTQAAIHGILAALLARERIGKGQLVETSIMQGLFAYDLGGLFRYQLAERLPDLFVIDPRAMASMMPTLNYHSLQTKDGRWIQFGNLMAHLFDNYVAAVGLDDIYADPDYEGPPTNGCATSSNTVALPPRPFRARRRRSTTRISCSTVTSSSETTHSWGASASSVPSPASPRRPAGQAKPAPNPAHTRVRCSRRLHARGLE